MAHSNSTVPCTTRTAQEHSRSARAASHRAQSEECAGVDHHCDRVPYLWLGIVQKLGGGGAHRRGRQGGECECCAERGRCTMDSSREGSTVKWRGDVSTRLTLVRRAVRSCSVLPRFRCFSSDRVHRKRSLFFFQCACCSSLSLRRTQISRRWSEHHTRAHGSSGRHADTARRAASCARAGLHSDRQRASNATPPATTADLDWPDTIDMDELYSAQRARSMLASVVLTPGLCRCPALPRLCCACAVVFRVARPN